MLTEKFFSLHLGVIGSSRFIDMLVYSVICNIRFRKDSLPFHSQGRTFVLHPLRSPSHRSVRLSIQTTHALPCKNRFRTDNSELWADRSFPNRSPISPFLYCTWFERLNIKSTFHNCRY